MANVVPPRRLGGQPRRAGLDGWASEGPGRTPWESIGRAITQEIVQLGESARFEYARKGSGTYRLRGPHLQGLSPRQAAVSITVDPSQIEALDNASHDAGCTRDELVNRILRRALWEREQEKAVQRWRSSYLTDPPGTDEASLADVEHGFEDEWEPRA